MIPNFKLLAPLAIVVLIVALYFYANSQLRLRDQKNFDAGLEQCKTAVQNENIKVQNEIIQENKAVNKRRQDNISTSFDDDFLWLQNNTCPNCSDN